MGWGEARADLERLARSDPTRTQFGASAHDYRLARRLSERTVRAFEQEHGVALPEDYRSFLTEMGNGRAGPGYGVFQLGRDLEAESFMDSLPVRLLARIKGRRRWPWGDMREPFPYEKALVLQPSEVDAILAAGQDNAVFVDPDPPGAIALCTHGCGLRD